MTDKPLPPGTTVIPTAEAVGTVLCHDITRIVPGECKGPAFKKGHIVTPDDIPALLALGKENLYVWTPQPGVVHENEAAARLARAACGPNLTMGKPGEGKINFTATRQGLLRVDVPLLASVNRLGRIAFATKHSLRGVAEGEAVAGVRIIPLMAEEELIRQAEDLCAAAPAPLVEVLPFKPARVGLIVTGSEIYHGRIKDGFGPVVRKKFAALGCTVIGERLTSDDVDLARDAILAFAAEGADMIVATGGMSVDPDDRTPAAIAASGAKVVAYGAPMFPGAMFMLAHLERAGGRVPVMGLPGCVMYHRATIFDIVLARLLAGVDVTAADIAAFGHGGFCANCPECHFPCCPFGI